MKLIKQSIPFLIIIISGLCNYLLYYSSYLLEFTVSNKLVYMPLMLSFTLLIIILYEGNSKLATTSKYLICILSAYSTCSLLSEHYIQLYNWPIELVETSNVILTCLGLLALMIIIARVKEVNETYYQIKKTIMP
jgi:hypothetical protein